MNIMTILGTRPELIKLSLVIKRLDEFADHVLVHTGQNYDYELNELLFKDLEIRQPDYLLNIQAGSLGKTIGKLLIESEKVILKENPDGLLVLGDTNSCLSAYIAARLRIPVFHMEAGNRSFDYNVPEEINRQVIDHIADYNFVTTEHARRFLLSEGLSPNKIYLTGSPLKEVLDNYKAKIGQSKILDTLNLKSKEYFVFSTHRKENVDRQENLQKLIIIMNQLVEQYNLPVIVTTHPRTREKIESLERQNPQCTTYDLVRFMKPFGFLDYVKLQMNAKCVLSDSGTISEESAILNFPAITMRKSLERQEAMDTGSIVLTGLDPEVVLNSISATIKDFETRNNQEIPKDYQIKNTSWRVLKMILGNVKIN